MIPTATLVLSLILASIYAGAFHVFKGKVLVELPIFWAAGVVGFIIGELVAQVLRLNFLMIGELHVVEASAVSIACLFIARWLKV